MLKTLNLNAEGHRSIAPFSGSNTPSMASPECNDGTVVPNLMQKDLQQSPLFNKMFKDFVTSHCGSQNCGSNSLLLGDAVNSPIKNSHQRTASPELPSSNLFQAGFQDCAVEVLRFLKEQEKMDVQNPLLQGLRSHLMNINKSISEDDLSPAPSSVFTDISHSSDRTPVPLRSSSPVLTESIKQSSCLLNPTESKKSSESLISGRKRNLDSSLYSSPASTLSSSKFLLPQNDTSFITPAKRGCFTHRTHEDTGNIPPLSYLASKVHTENSFYSIANLLVSSSSSLPKTGYSKTESDTQTTPSMSSSSLLSSHVGPLKTPDKTLTSRHLSEAATVRFPSNLMVPDPTQLTHYAVHGNSSNLHSLASSSSLSPTTVQTVDPVGDIDISTVTPDNLEDVLLSVESCQAHEDPRVRTLASRIINLIHNIDEDEDDDNVEDGENDGIENDQECEENRHDLEDSGIDLEEE